jgi:hypothetical protein
MVPGLFSTNRTKQSISGQQTFERLEEHQSNNIYPMDRMGHPVVRTDISSANTTESQRDLYDKDTSLVSSNESIEGLDNRKRGRQNFCSRAVST